MPQSDVTARSTTQSPSPPTPMVKVVNNVAQLTQLKINSKYRWFKRVTVTTAPRILIIAIMFFTVAFVLAVTVVHFVSADSFSGPFGSHSYTAFPSSSSVNMPSRHAHPSSPASTHTMPPPHFPTHASSSNKSYRQPTGPSLLVAAQIKTVITEFMNTAPNELYSEALIREHFDNDDNNSHNTTMMVSILNGVATFTHHFHESRHGRAPSAKYIVNKMLQDRVMRGDKPMPNVTFMVMVNDGHRPRVAMFGSARHWRNWNALIPAPLGNERGVAQGWGTPIEGWNEYVNTHITSTHINYPWISKVSKAMFRGALGMQSYTLGSCNWDNRFACKRAMSWREVNRGVMYLKAKKNPKLFDVGFTSLRGRTSSPTNAMDDAPEVADDVSFQDFQRYKYLLNVGSNQDWAERLRCLLFTNSAVVLHEAETKEFFTPLLQPWEHYIPTDLLFSDLVTNVRWAVNNDDAVRRIVDNQHAFARSYLSEAAMQLYWEIAVEQFALRQQATADPRPIYKQ